MPKLCSNRRRQLFSEELYNLADDIGEKQNLASQKAGRAADLKQKLRVWRQSVLAHMPIPNPGFEPDKAAQWWSTRSGKPVPSSRRKRFPQTEKGQ